MARGTLIFSIDKLQGPTTSFQSLKMSSLAQRLKRFRRARCLSFCTIPKSSRALTAKGDFYRTKTNCGIVVGRNPGLIFGGIAGNQSNRDKSDQAEILKERVRCIVVQEF